MTVNKPSYQELEKRIQELENESLERRRIEAELLEKQSILRKQNINLVRKSIELSDIKIELEDKNYELELIRSELRKQNINLVRKSIELSDIMRDLEDKNYDLELSRADLEKTLAELHKNEQFSSSLLTNSPHPIIVINPDTSVKYVNPALEKLTGFSSSELIGKGAPYPWWTEETLQKTGRDLEEAMVTGAQRLEELFEKKNGGRFWVEITSTPVSSKGELKYYLANWVDVTDRKLAEEGLRKYESIISTVDDPMSFIDKNYIYGTINDAYTRIFNAPREEIIGRSVAEMLGEDAFDNHIKGYLDRCLGGEEVHYQDWFDFPDGKRRFMDMSYYPYFDKGGTVSGVVVNGRDMTELELARLALNRANLELNQVFNSSIPLCMIDKDYNLRRFNMTLCKLFGLDEETIHDKKCYQVLPTPLCDTPKCPMKQILSNDEVREHELEIQLRSGGTVSCLVTANPLEGNEGELLGIVENFMDITQLNEAKEEKHKLEAQLQQAQKLEAIGTLAGGIAHDFNNLLSVIQGNASMMLFDIDAAHPHYERVKNIEKQVQRGSTLTRQLLGYARKGRYDVKSIDMNQLVEEVSDTFGRTRKEITIHRDLAENLFAIEADDGQIERVLLNMYVNAADAMPRGGDLGLKTMNVSHKDMKGKLYDPRPGNYVLLQVSDTGTGMDKDTMDRIFDPFFTTKEMGRGAGLGLASVYGIIKSHRGYIDVESEKDRGTTFAIYLPASEKKVQKTVETAKQIIEGSGTILLVDDEDMVLDIGVKVLKRLGYTVLEAKRGREAVEIYKDNKDKIDLVILDMIMPEMGGGEVYDRMKEINPDVKVLLSSGYSIDGQAKEILRRGCDDFMQKPFTMEELSQSVRDVLGKE